MNVVVRELTPDEWELWRDLRLRALADAPDAYGRTLETERDVPGDEWRDRMATTDRVHLVAETDGRPVGIAASAIDPTDRTVAHVFAMWVRPSARRSGAARTLLDRAVVWAAERGAVHVELSVTEGNAGAYALYERAGFVDTGRREPLREGSTLQIIHMRRSTRQSGLT